jgi:general secretion pathway protein L
MRGEFWWVRWRPDGLDWAQRAAEETSPRQAGSCPGWADLPAPEGARLIVIVPPEAVRVHTVALPTRSRTRFRAALPYALEDHLLHDPEAYHFAPLPKPRGQTPTAVAVVERSRMDAWLDGTEGQGWRLRSLVPEYLTLAPPEPGVWQMDASESPMLLRLPRGGGGAGLAEGPAAAPPGGLLLALEGTDRPPRTLRVRVADGEQRALVAQWHKPLADRGIDLDVQEDDRPRFTWLTRQPLPERVCNLLTGPYASGEDPRQWARRLAPAAAMLGALVLVAGGQWALEGARIRAEHQRLQQAINDTYRQAFPQAKNLVDPRYQMEQRLERLRRRGKDVGGAGLLPRLARAAPLLQGDGEARVQALRFDGRSLTIDVSVPDYQALERLERGLAQTGEVTVDNAELRDGRVHGRLRVQGDA